MQAVKESVTLRNDVEMPLIGLGVMHTYGSECVRSICEAVDTGYRMIDTAAIYGNEQAVGQGIRECGVDRDELFITTKVWISNGGYEKAKTSLRESLCKLQSEYIESCVIHGIT